MTWRVPRDWEGETCVILGGGPSLKGFDAAPFRGRFRVIGVNEAGLSMAPWADVLYWADHRWLAWNHGRLGEHTGTYKICRHRPKIETGFDVKVLPHSKAALSDGPTRLSGFCSGGACINLAYLFGATRIVLLGFDMGGGQWHDRHLKPTDQNRYRTRFIPTIEKMAGPLRAAGVEVLNATPGSALTCFPMTTLEEIMSDTFGYEDVETDAEDIVEPVAAVETVEKLEHTPYLQLDRAIAGIVAKGDAVIVIRPRSREAQTRRSPEWWHRRLRQAFASVSIAETGRGEYTFTCRA